jgi:nitroimidazol reductase NimA-like FMN-containing flavoprotein (pyridoxamine 5'-phosphate oxidase superfamily)
MKGMDTSQSPRAPSAPPDDVRATTRHESWELLREGVIGRLAVIYEGAPEIFPVNYVVDHGSVVIRTAGGTKHEAARKRRVAFEVDGYDLAAGEAWSVVAKGRVVEVDDVDEAIEVMTLPLFPWAGGSKPHLLRLAPDSLTGRRFRVTGGARRS